MPNIDTRWMHNHLRLDPEEQPEFTFYWPSTDPETSDKLRAAFAFLRRNADRRYSANSLMRLLSYAEDLEERQQNGRPVTEGAFPMVALATIPFSYNEDTEVKQGGIVAAAVLLPDNRLMMAVHTERREEKLGTAMLGWVEGNIAGPRRRSITAWVHGENSTGQHFCLANGLRPRSINGAGAVAYSRYFVVDEDNMAVPTMEDYELDIQLEERQRANARTARRRATEAFAYSLPRPIATDAVPGCVHPGEPEPGEVDWDHTSAEVDPPCDCRQCSDARAFSTAFTEVNQA